MTYITLPAINSQIRLGHIVRQAGIAVATVPAIYIINIILQKVTLLAAALDMPLQDDVFMRLDHLLGYDWQTVFNYVNAHPILLYILQFAYFSGAMQSLIVTVHYAALGEGKRVLGMIQMAVVAALITTVVFGLIPTLGPPSQHIAGAQQILLAVREQGLSAMQSNAAGFICFPSYHAAAAVVMTAVHRGTLLFWPFALLNGIMLISAGPIGGHYLCDLIAGTVIGLIVARFWNAQTN